MALEIEEKEITYGLKSFYGNWWSIKLVNRIEHRMVHLLVNSNALLVRYKSDLLSQEAKMMLKRKQYFHKKQGFSKGQMSILLF